MKKNYFLEEYYYQRFWFVIKVENPDDSESRFRVNALTLSTDFQRRFNSISEMFHLEVSAQIRTVKLGFNELSGTYKSCTFYPRKII